jgi:hypothetical protein
MMPRLRSLSLPALAAVLPLAIAALAGCASTSSAILPNNSTLAPSASSTATGTNAAATSQAASSPAATVAASTSTSASPIQSATRPASTAPPGPKVYLAEGGDVRGTIAYRPGCASGCGLSGDGTTGLWNMTWTAWDSIQADGTGTEKLDDCNPDCATGTLHAVPVRVALSKPVLVCASGKGTWYWTRVIFTWPDGLPAVFSGDNTPANPFDYQGITAQQATSCS